MIPKIIDKGIAYLTNQQQKDGSFLSFSTTNKRSFKNAKKYHSTFPSSLILSCLCSLEETPEIKRIKDRLATFLLSQKSKHWSFNYWTRNSKEAKTLPYPDDLDDTFCALVALYQYNPELIDGSAMAKIVTLLTAVEKKEGGPYRTWLVPHDADKVWKDVDLVANSNIAYFLSLQDVSLPSIDALIESAIKTENYVSPYYPSIYPVIYFISRFYKGKKTKKIRDFLLSKRDASEKWDNPLNTALAISSLLNFGASLGKLKKSIVYLTTRQRHGSWQPYAFCIDPAIKRKTYCAGSSALTTAFCLEVIGKYLQKSKIKSQRLKVQKERETGKQVHIYNQVVREAKQRFSKLDDDLKTQAMSVLKAILKRDKDRQIILMPYFFKISLGKNRKTVSKNLLVQLGLANLYGWIAYTIYDDFLDDEGEPRLLSVANLALRELTTIFNTVLPKETGFQVFFHKTMDTIDAANTWEVSNCRIKIEGSKLNIQNLKIPDYGDLSRLAHRSLGHALGPAAILFSLGYKASSSELKNLMHFFKHFLIARQLNDEAHDWEEDFKMGRINAVGFQILKRVRNKKLGIKEFQKIFWTEIVVGVCQTVLKHTQLARKALDKIPIICDPSLMEKLLIPIEASAQKALREREETLKFLKTYGKTTS